MECIYYSGDNWSRVMDWAVKLWYTEDMKKERLGRLTAGKTFDDLWMPMKYLANNGNLMVNDFVIPKKVLVSLSQKERKFYFRLPHTNENNNCR